MLCQVQVLGFLSFIALASCATVAPLLEVDDFKLRSIQLADRDAPMVRADQSFFLFGRVSMEERKAALGQYLTIRRRDTQNPAELKIYYQQAKTGSKILSRTHSFQEGDQTYEWKVTGEEYIQQGRILAWKIELWENKKMLASKQSYMWNELPQS
jgi:hypothetical protein